MKTEFGDHFEFEWRTGINLELVKNYIGDTEKNIRCCFIGTQKSRVYLMLLNGSPVFCPYILRNNQWKELYSHKQNVSKPSVEDLESEESLKSALSLQMAKQFRCSVEGYLEEHPSSEEVRAVACIPDCTVAMLSNRKYMVTETTVEEDKEWDGAVEVICDDGLLVIPYVESEDGTKRLVSKYATLERNSFIDSVMRIACRVIDSLYSNVRGLHWSNFRTRVDGRW